MWDMQKKHMEHAGMGKRSHESNRATRQCRQCWHIVTDGRKKSEGLIIAVLASAVWMSDALRSIEQLPFPVSQA